MRLSYLANSWFSNYKTSPRILSQHRVLQNLRKNKDIEVHGVVILDQKLYENTIQEIISGTSKFEKLNEDSTLKREASVKRFLCTLKQKNFLNEIEYDKLYPSGSAPARTMILLKCANSPLVIHFLKFVRLFHL